jgi:hypothetical protein
MIQGRDQITMAAQVSAKECRLQPIASAAMRKNDQRVGSGLSSSVAHSHLIPMDIV